MENEELNTPEATQIPEEEQTQEEEKQDVQKLINDLKAQYDDKLLKQHDMYEKRIKDRDNVIKQLLAGDNHEEEKDVIQLRIEAINEKRTLQNKKW